MRYFFLLIFFHYAREIERILIFEILHCSINSLLFTFLMFFAEFFGGIAIIVYQKLSFLKKRKKNPKYKDKVKLINTKRKMKKSDNKFKIILLIFFCSFFDFTEFVILYILPKIAVLSPTSDQRMYFIITITSSLLCIYALRFKIGRHHIFSLIGMSICSVIILTLEFIYKPIENSYLNFTLAYLLVFLELIFVSFIDVTERYLVEYDFMNKFKILSAEGFFGIILCIIFSVVTKINVIKEIKNIYEKLIGEKKALMIFFIILYFILSAGVNIYKIICNVVYTPIAKSLPAFILNPIFLIYYLLRENDFTVGGKRNYFYFIANVILSLIINFFSLVYNEFLILICCGLEQSTFYSISLRSLQNTINEESGSELVSINSDYHGINDEE